MQPPTDRLAFVKAKLRSKVPQPVSPMLGPTQGPVRPVWCSGRPATDPPPPQKKKHVHGDRRVVNPSSSNWGVRIVEIWAVCRAKDSVHAGKPCKRQWSRQADQWGRGLQKGMGSGRTGVEGLLSEARIGAGGGGVGGSLRASRGARATGPS